VPRGSKIFLTDPFYFPQVLIRGKVVFRAPEPFGVIRPNEVLKMFFTEMGENGRTGRFRILTNLTAESYAKLKVQASTGAIEIADLTPALPFVVDGTLNIGRADGGSYGVAVDLDGKRIWNADGIIRVVKPNVGQTGLVQRLQTADGFQRPGDVARFTLLGSGFQPEDVNMIKAIVPG
jgi:hypothetical protein